MKTYLPAASAFAAIAASLAAPGQPQMTLPTSTRAGRSRWSSGSAGAAKRDGVARFFQPHFAEHMRGKPSVIVQNMPGAGRLKALNRVYNTPPQDGTRVMLTSPPHMQAIRRVDG